MPSKSKRGQKPAPAWRWLVGQFIDLVRRFANSVIWAGVVCFFIWEGAYTLQVFAGKTSIANLVFEVAAKFNLTVVASLTLSGVTTGLWVNECRRHRNTRKWLTERSAALELRLDGKRESSLLTPEGTTRKGDQ